MPETLEPLIVRAWPCVPLTERTVAVQFATASATIPPFVAAATVDPIFAAGAPGWAETRREAFEANWAAPRIVFEIDGVEVPGYLALNQWCADLLACQEDDDCLLTSPKDTPCTGTF